MAGESEGHMEVTGLMHRLLKVKKVDNVSKRKRKVSVMQLPSDYANNSNAMAFVSLSLSLPGFLGTQFARLPVFLT